MHEPSSFFVTHPKIIPTIRLIPIWEHVVLSSMRIISKKILREFWENHAVAEQPLKAWNAKIKLARWRTSTDIKTDYRNASFVANNRVIFNIKGNTYRLVVAVNYDFGIIYIRFVGSHREYDKIEATLI